MSALAISNSDMLEIQFRKSLARGHVHNVTLKPTYSHPSVPPGETVIAEVIDRNGRGLFFTSNGFTRPGRRFIHYDDIVSVEWISALPIHLKNKRDDWDHIQIFLHDSSPVVLADIEQAVFPLLHFFRWMIKKRKHGV